MRKSSDKQKCSVLNCPSTRREKYHQYPKCENTGSEWVKASGNPKLQNQTYKDVLESRYVICCHHFRPDDYRCSTQLKKLKEGAVPSLLLPDSNINISTKDPNANKIDVEDKNVSPHASPKVSLLTANFSPITFRNWISKSPGSSDFRKSSLVSSTESSDSSAPSKLTSVNCEQDSSVAPTSNLSSSSVNCENEHVLFADTSVDVNSGASEIGESSKKDFTVQSADEAVNANVSTESRKKSTLKSRACKRLVWKKRNLDDLDESKRQMYERILEARKERDNYRTKSLRYAHRLQKLTENVNAAEFDGHLQKLSTLQQHFISMILRNANKPKQGRRYTADERLLCLSIYKRSAAAYRYLCGFLPLPTPRRVRQVLSQIRLDCGVTKTIKNCLKEAADRITDDLEKVCVLMWDEVALRLHVQYCAERDKVIGLEDWGSKRTCKYADHALVFMVRGIKSGWKIPLTYNFCAGQTTDEQLKFSIKEVVRAVTEAGFVVAATVCDQGSSNMKAIKSLQAETDRIREEKGIEKYWTILIDDVEIVPLYDPPHLLKCIRNNFLNKDIEVDFDDTNWKERKFASWKHIITAYEIDIYSDFLERNVPHLTEQHIYIDKI